MRPTSFSAILLFVLSSLLLSYAVLSSAYPEPSTASCGPVDDLTVVRREEFDGGRIIDISHVYREDMPSWKKAEEGLGQFLWLSTSIKNGSGANSSWMKMPTHTGTHVDAPGHVFDHYFDAGFDVDTLDLAVLNGCN